MVFVETVHCQARPGQTGDNYHGRERHEYGPLPYGAAVPGCMGCLCGVRRHKKLHERKYEQTRQREEKHRTRAERDAMTARNAMAPTIRMSTPSDAPAVRATTCHPARF